MIEIESFVRQREQIENRKHIGCLHITSNAVVEENETSIVVGIERHLNNRSATQIIILVDDSIGARVITHAHLAQAHHSPLDANVAEIVGSRVSLFRHQTCESGEFVNESDRRPVEFGLACERGA